MKKLMILFFFGLYLCAFALLVDAETLYSEQGFPYKDLIHRTDSVKIFYTEKRSKVSCRVEVQLAEQIWKSNQRETSSEAFDKQPLKSCLARDDAKKLLAKTFG